MTLNKNVLTIALVSVSLFALAGCDQKKTEEWYMDHPDALLKKYAECLNTQTFSSEECIPPSMPKKVNE